MSPTPQLPLALRPPPDQRFETFIGSSDVVAWLQGLPQAPAHGLLTGPHGSGKTHLALATVQEAALHGLAVQYVPLMQLRRRASVGLLGLERLALVVLDDLDVLCGERDDEVALFDFHNRASDAGVAVLYTASKAAAALPIDLPDLRSRLAQCTQLLLPRADDALRRAILQSKAQTRGLVLEDAAIDFLLRHSERDTAALAGLLARLDRASLAEQRRLTVPFIRAFLEREAGAD